MSDMDRIPERQYRYKTPKICQALGVSRQTLFNWEREGKFTPPRDFRGDRIVTIDQLKSIMQAFSPGGRGYWHFRTTATGKVIGHTQNSPPEQP